MSRHGCTEKCAAILKDSLNEETYLANLKNARITNLNEYEWILIGGSIHAGRLQKPVRKFCEKNLDFLRSKKVGLFLCCMEEGETAEKQFNEAFPEELIKHAAAKGIFGGEFNFEKMSFIERAIIKKIAKIEKSVSKISRDKIDDFVKQTNNLNYSQT